MDNYRSKEAKLDDSCHELWRSFTQNTLASSVCLPFFESSIRLFLRAQMSGAGRGGWGRMLGGRDWGIDDAFGSLEW